ncbi:ferrochelatase [Rhodospirillaceae bacterium SYSU D60014]|uniref:ferrochelatase n=1 Tax=Virgifigura deserti TaxID=2268457 RepID=UPI000E66AE3B
MPKIVPKIAVVLFNLGGPDRPDSVQPFLFNLFYDPAIIALPNPFRWLIATLVSRRRAPVAREIYEHIGGGSPLLANTQAQAAALAAVLRDLGEVRVFPCMRYWHPMSADVVAAVQAFAPDRVILLPLYPQFSSTTTASSDRAWRQAAAEAGLSVPTQLICCYPTEAGFVSSIAERTRHGIAEASGGMAGQQPRVLFSAHGLPKKVVARGDPYPDQVEETAAAIARLLELRAEDWVVCYQSRVGPLEWIGPSTDAELRRAGADGVPVVVVPIAFVSEHSETLVELDIEYRRLAEEIGIPRYVRVATVGTDAAFIEGAAAQVRAALAEEGNVRSQSGPRRCAADQSCCPNKAA